MSDLLNKASLVVIPSGYKEDTVYSVVPSDGSGDLSFTRASNGTRINSAGLVEVVPWNLLLNTNTFSSWDLEGGTLTSGFNAPDGSSTAYKYVKTSGGFYSGSATATSGNKTVTVWLKSVSGTSITCNLADGGNSNSTTVTVTGDWQLFTFTYTTSTSRPSLYIYSISNASGIYVWHPQLNIGSTAKPYFPTTDRLNVPRLTYQNGGGGCPSLLLEPQRTNVETYSQDFSNAAWTKTNCSITANSTTSPDGTTNASKIIENSANGVHFVYNVGATISVAQTLSVYAKADTRTQLALQLGASSVIYNLSSGTIVSGSGGSIESVGNGWYRCAITTTPANTNALIFTANGGTNSYQGDGTSGLFIWGAQLETGAYPTTYIPTTSASATRVADVASNTSATALIGQTEGTILIDCKILTTDTQDLITIRPGGTSSLVIGTASNLILGYVIEGATVISMSFANYAINTRYKIALAYKNGDCALYVNGTQADTDTTAFTFSTALSSLYLGLSQYFGKSSYENNEVVLFKTRLTNAELASLTTI
jgi:hypothetical protein